MNLQDVELTSFVTTPQKEPVKMAVPSCTDDSEQAATGCCPPSPA